MRRWTRIIRAVVFGVVGLSMVATHLACNTFEGAGRDVERAGEKMQDAADDAR